VHRLPRTFYTGSAFGVPATGAKSQTKLLAKSVCMVKVDLEPTG